MADVARIGNFQRVGVRRTDELKRVTAHMDIGDGLLNLRHMAGHTLAAFAVQRSSHNVRSRKLR